MKINGVVVPDPVSIRPRTVRVEKKRQTANGNTVIDFIGLKKEVQVSWGVLDDSEAKTIINAIESSTNGFVELTYPDVGGDTTITAYISNIDRKILSIYGGTIKWAYMSITFRER